MVSFREVVLVDTDSVDPEICVRILVLCDIKEGLKSFYYLEASSIEIDAILYIIELIVVRTPHI